MSYNAKDLTDEKFGRLTVIEKDRVRSTKQASFWVCRCDCGQMKSIRLSCLTRLIKPVRSCGCLKRGNNGGRPKGATIEALAKKATIRQEEFIANLTRPVDKTQFKYDWCNEMLPCAFDGKNFYGHIGKTDCE